MRHILCILGRHKWRTQLTEDLEPYQICIRERCQRYRNDQSVLNVPPTNLPPSF